MINTKCSSSHNRRALCCKMSVEFDRFLDSGRNGKIRKQLQDPCLAAGESQTAREQAVIAAVNLTTERLLIVRFIVRREQTVTFCAGIPIILGPKLQYFLSFKGNIISPSGTAPTGETEGIKNANADNCSLFPLFLITRLTKYREETRKRGKDPIKVFLSERDKTRVLTPFVVLEMAGRVVSSEENVLDARAAALGR
ncbi:Beta-1,3-N-acetylglucosaminyltransferase radical fringe [Melipona quadrifasciata]|uniref:Beta-1,3-N-acetylglucosaminyltransferase radical fringe n=1 Tax=Melipona quadrifasciata TaxID=166423 RepID=A0A0M9AA76_9HYME|nr:Beta-1,3-N-acetylglucosaminyltransferase radical fringe [Melipona quadrifasciata]